MVWFGSKTFKIAYTALVGITFLCTTFLWPYSIVSAQSETTLLQQTIESQDASIFQELGSDGDTISFIEDGAAVLDGCSIDQGGGPFPGFSTTTVTIGRDDGSRPPTEDPISGDYLPLCGSGPQPGDSVILSEEISVDALIKYSDGRFINTEEESGQFDFNSGAEGVILPWRRYSDADDCSGRAGSSIDCRSNPHRVSNGTSSTLFWFVRFTPESNDDIESISAFLPADSLELTEPREECLDPDEIDSSCEAPRWVDSMTDSVQRYCQSACSNLRLGLDHNYDPNRDEDNDGIPDVPESWEEYVQFISYLEGEDDAPLESISSCENIPVSVVEHYPSCAVTDDPYPANSVKAAIVECSDLPGESLAGGSTVGMRSTFDSSVRTNIPPIPDRVTEAAYDELIDELSSPNIFQRILQGVAIITSALVTGGVGGFIAGAAISATAKLFGSIGTSAAQNFGIIDDNEETADRIFNDFYQGHAEDILSCVHKKLNALPPVRQMTCGDFGVTGEKTELSRRDFQINERLTWQPTFGSTFKGWIFAHEPKGYFEANAASGNICRSLAVRPGRDPELACGNAVQAHFQSFIRTDDNSCVQMASKSPFSVEFTEIRDSSERLGELIDAARNRVNQIEVNPQRTSPFARIDTNFGSQCAVESEFVRWREEFAPAEPVTLEHWVDADYNNWDQPEVFCPQVGLFNQRDYDETEPDLVLACGQDLDDLVETQEVPQVVRDSRGCIVNYYSTSQDKYSPGFSESDRIANDDLGNRGDSCETTAACQIGLYCVPDGNSTLDEVCGDQRRRNEFCVTDDHCGGPLLCSEDNQCLFPQEVIDFGSQSSCDMEWYGDYQDARDLESVEGEEWCYTRNDFGESRDACFDVEQECELVLERDRLAYDDTCTCLGEECDSASALGPDTWYESVYFAIKDISVQVAYAPYKLGQWAGGKIAGLFAPERAYALGIPIPDFIIGFLVDVGISQTIITLIPAFINAFQVVFEFDLGLIEYGFTILGNAENVFQYFKDFEFTGNALLDLLQNDQGILDQTFSLVGLGGEWQNLSVSNPVGGGEIAISAALSELGELDFQQISNLTTNIFGAVNDVVTGRCFDDDDNNDVCPDFGSFVDIISNPDRLLSFIASIQKKVQKYQSFQDFVSESESPYCYQRYLPEDEFEPGWAITEQFRACYADPGECEEKTQDELQDETVLEDGCSLYSQPALCGSEESCFCYTVGESQFGDDDADPNSQQRCDLSIPDDSLNSIGAECQYLVGDDRPTEGYCEFNTFTDCEVERQDDDESAGESCFLNEDYESERQIDGWCFDTDDGTFCGYRSEQECDAIRDETDRQQETTGVSDGCYPNYGSAEPTSGTIGELELGDFAFSETGELLIRETRAREKDRCLDAITRQSAQFALQNLRESAQDWIEGGFEQFGQSGNPGEVGDLRTRMQNVALYKLNEYINPTDEGGEVQPQFSGICNVFRDELLFSLNEEIRDEEGSGSSIESLTASDFDSIAAGGPGCTLEQVIIGERGGSAEDVQAFLEGDFSRGGWDAWNALFSDPQSSPQGAYLTQRRRVNQEIDQAIDQDIRQLRWGYGFLPQQEDGTTVTPASTVASVISRIRSSDISSAELSDEFNEIIPDFTTTILFELIQ